MSAGANNIGGIEYLVDDRDGHHYFYDINALSNFVADGRNVVGFDPFERLVDYLVARVASARAGARPSVLAAPRQTAGAGGR